MTKQDYIDGIYEFFQTDEYRVDWNGFDSKKNAQKNGIEHPTCKVTVLKEGNVVRSAECPTEIEAIRKIYAEVSEAEYQEALKKAHEEADRMQEQREKEEKQRRKTQLEANILQALTERKFVMIQVSDGEMRQCLIGGVGILTDGSNGIAVFQYFGKPESDNRKWHIFKEDEIKSLHIMTEAHEVVDKPADFESEKIWGCFSTVLNKIIFPEKKTGGFLSKLFKKKQ